MATQLMFLAAVAAISVASPVAVTFHAFTMIEPAAGAPAWSPTVALAAASATPSGSSYGEAKAASTFDRPVTTVAVPVTAATPRAIL